MNDPGDENDSPETDAEWLKRQLVTDVQSAHNQARNDRVWQRILARDWIGVRVFASLRPGDGHDPGDEDNRVELIHINPCSFTCEVL